MDQKTREALEGSILKWEKIVDGTGRDAGTSNCPLCKMFYEEEDPVETGAACCGCPVKAHTGKTDCKGSPFHEWRAVIPLDQGYPFYAINEEQKAAAKKELEFLKSLRPVEDN